MTVDWIAVGREAHQVKIDHGLRAYAYASKRANEAHERKSVEEEEFWSAIAACLRSRATATRS